MTADVKATAFIDVLMSYPLKERRAHCNLLFGLDLHKVNVVPAPTAPAGKMGNKTEKLPSLALRISALLTAFFARMKTAVNANEFPTLQVLTGGGSYKSAAQLKARDQNRFKAITGDLPPNNKRVGAGNAVLFCAPVREQIQQIEAIGTEKYYQGLSKAIADAGDGFITDFSYTGLKSNALRPASRTGRFISASPVPTSLQGRNPVR